MSGVRPAPEFDSFEEVHRLVRRFERCELTREEWDHRAHLAVAMWYLVQCDEVSATTRMIAGIRRFNHAKGIRGSPRGGYHETLTLFWLGVGRRLADGAADATPLTLVNRFLSMPKSVPMECYSEDVLWSCDARCTWVEPDLKSIDDLLAGLSDRTDLRSPAGLALDG